VKAPAFRAVTPLGLVTAMSTVPAAWAAILAVIRLELMTLAGITTPLMASVAPDWKPDPLTWMNRGARGKSCRRSHRGH